MEKTRQWERVKELFQSALEQAPAQRGEFLRRACGDDESLKSEVESLLVAHEQADGLSQALPIDLLEEAQAPKTIGPYQLIRKLGGGGMGQVWLAEQTAPLHRQVALKLIRAGMYDDTLLRRFQAERQSLAMMDHPAIAKVFDAGATPDGQPYFVMEYVPGVPITEYCDQKKLSIPERLELCLKVCEGVQHAHQKAVIHRDLKPANILVVEVDGKPVPRIIDFGLAKAATPVLAGETMFTQIGMFVGTPGYMSPEQADPSISDVDTRTDVYSLGVILYELLTGVLPFDTRKWQKQPLHEMVRRMKEQDAVRPSTRIESGKEASVAAAEQRSTQAKQLASLLQGDLDWIAMKAIEKDRARRYGTPSELAADIEHYLRNEPVVARPASVGYRLERYVRRHRVAVSIATGLVILLAAFAVVQAVQLRRITRERDRAARERDRANRITDFMTGMFKVSDPSEARGNSITAREILDKASKNIDTGLAKDPELQAQMAFVMGRVYGSLGLYAKAQSLLQEAVDVRRKVLGPENLDTLRAQTELAWMIRLQGHYSQAESILRQTLDAQKRILGTANADTIKTTSNLAVVLSDEGRLPEAETMFRAVLEGRQRTMGPNSPDTIIAMNNMATVLFNEHKYADAEKIYRQVLETRQRTLGLDHPYTLLSMNNLAVTLHSEGNYAEAKKLKEETLAIRRRVLGAEHPDTLLSMSNLADTLMSMHDYAGAESLLRQALEIQKRVLGPENPQTIISMTNLADALMKAGQYDQAEAVLKPALELQRRVLGPDHPNTAVSVYSLACLKALEKKPGEAISLLREALNHGLPTWVSKNLGTDSDLMSLHGDPRFIALIAEANRHVQSAQDSH